MSALTIRLWDGFVRGFHWLLVALLAGLWWTGGNIEYIDQHQFLGVTVLALLMTRVLWGLFGSHPARFTHFVKNPLYVIRHLRNPFSSKDPLTHNPAGGYMVVVMLALILAQALSGLFTDDDIFFRGPLAHWVEPETVRALTRYHRIAFDAILIAIALHVVAVIVYLVKGKNLITPMITGNKKVSEPAEQPRQLHGGLGFLLLAVNLTWLHWWLG